MFWIPPPTGPGRSVEEDPLPAWLVALPAAFLCFLIFLLCL